MPKTKANLKRKIYIVTASGVLMIVLTLALGLLTITYFNEAQNHWKEYSQDEVILSKALAELNKNIGYGGLIHNLKNLIIRRDLNRYSEVIDRNIAELNYQLKIIKEHSDSHTDNHEHTKIHGMEDQVAIAQLTLTFKDYAVKAEIAKRMVIEGKTTHEIDAVIRVSDTKALAAMSVLSSNINIRTKSAMENADIIALKAEQVLQYGGFLIFIGIILVSLFLVFYLRQLLVTNEKLKQAKESAEYASMAKSQFLSSMSHELRTPMNAILGFSQLIEMNVKNDLEKENISEVIFAGKHLLSLINDVLDLAQIESGKTNLTIDSYNINGLLNDCLSIIKPVADKHSIKIDNKISSFSDCIIDVDERRFKQVLLNLLSNAIKYNSENGEVIIDCSPIEDNILALSVTDTGNGLTPKQQDNLFKPFERAGADHSHIEGIGLGLVISKDLIELMGGMMGVESEIGKGSRFWITAPLSKL